jgi:putative RNA 2'-phosphotransferase
MTTDKTISKAMSLWLRHEPGKAGLLLDAQGWAPVEAVLAALGRARLECDWERLLHVVESNDKQRFELSADAGRIRARQGHSVEVTLDWPTMTPPELLYHGTVAAALDAILAEGLTPGRRHHVHLSGDLETARRVGARRGAPVILAVRAADMARAGSSFMLTANLVWLTEHVPPRFITRLDP